MSTHSKIHRLTQYDGNSCKRLINEVPSHVFLVNNKVGADICRTATALISFFSFGNYMSALLYYMVLGLYKVQLHFETLAWVLIIQRISIINPFLYVETNVEIKLHTMFYWSMGILRGPFITVMYIKILLRLKSILLPIRNLWKNMQKVDNVVFLNSAKNRIKMLILSTFHSSRIGS